MWDFKVIEEQFSQQIPLKIRDLKDHPQEVQTIVKWTYDEWASFAGRTYEQIFHSFRTGIEKEGLPISLIALYDNQPVGVANLREKDIIDFYPGTTPWICGVFVKDEARHRGIATALCKAFEQVAKKMGYSTLYLATEYENSLYHKMGYKTFHIYDHKGQILYVAKLELT